MAIATTTALAIGGLAVSAGSTVMSFSQASKQQKLQRQAEEKAAASMAEAKRKLSVNFAKERSIKKEPYELAREAMLSQGAQSIQAGVESDRGAETTAGKVQMAQNVGQGQIRSSMGEELTDIEKDIINEESRLRDLGVQLDLGEVEGAQLAARDAQEAKTQAMYEGMQGLTNTLQQGLAMVPLYAKTNVPKQAAPVGNPPANPLPGDKASYGPMGLNWNPQASYNTVLPSLGVPVGPQLPKPGTLYGPMGLNWSGLGY